MAGALSSSQGEAKQRVLTSNTVPTVSRSTPKPDVSQLFQKLGDKLGWFQYNDIDAAIQTLSKSTKKKSTRSRREKDVQDGAAESSSTKPKRKLHEGSRDEDGRKKRHDKQDNDDIEDFKENKKSTRKPASVQPCEPLRVHVSNLSDDEMLGVPARKSAACTDLTKPNTTECRKKSKKIKTKTKQLTKYSSESPIPELPDIQVLKYGRENRLYSDRSLSECSEYFGDVMDSTRIHKDISPECVLDSADVSAIPYNCSENVSGITDTDSWIHNSNNDSYKQLNIKGRRSRTDQGESNKSSPSENDVCLNFQTLRLDDPKLCGGKGRNSSRASDKTDLYSTAMENNDDSVDYKSKSVFQTKQKRTESSSGSSYEVEDVSVQVDVEPDVFSGEPDKSRSGVKSSDSSPVSERTTSGSGSSYEVEDVSIQVDIITRKSPHSQHVNDSMETKLKECPGSSHQQPSPGSHTSDDMSYIEVEDVSMQTSFVLPVLSPKHDSAVAKAKRTVNATSKYDSVVEREDIMGKDCDNENSCHGNVKESNDISLPDLDLEQCKVTLKKRDQSIYFDAKDLPGQERKFKKRDPSVYFDAKQSLLSHSSTSNSSCELKESTGDLKFVSKGDNRGVLDDADEPSCVVSISDTDSDHEIVMEKPCKINGKMSKPKKTLQINIVSSETDSSDDHVTISRRPKSKHKNNRVKSSTQKDNSDDSDSYFKSLQKQGLPRPKDTTSLGDKTGNGRARRTWSDSSDDALPDLDVADQKNVSGQHWRTKLPIAMDSSSDDDALENFFQKMKSTKKKISSSSEEEEEERSKIMNMQEFIVEDSEVSSGEDEDEAFYLTTNYRSSIHSQDDERKIVPIIYRDSSSEEEDFKTPRTTLKKKVSRHSSSDDEGLTTSCKTPKETTRPDCPFKTPLSTKKIKRRTPGTDHWGLKEENCVYPPNTKYSFLKSLTENLPPGKCDPEALRFVKTFKKSKQDLTQRLFKLYNETVFDNQLPRDMDVIWNSRLLKTAGYCVYKRVASSGTSRSVRVELSTKVCDSAERVRDTLIHEMCHAAVWFLNGTTDGHGPYWKYWAKKSNLVHPEIPVIARCHSYAINTKFTYQCSQCGYRIGRHSKSLDMDRKVCGYCHGRFMLLSNSGRSGSTPGGATTPRTPNKFALFVKENYGDIKKREQNLKHKDVMKILSQEFAKQKISG